MRNYFKKEKNLFITLYVFTLVVFGIMLRTGFVAVNTKNLFLMQHENMVIVFSILFFPLVVAFFLFLGGFLINNIIELGDSVIE